MTLLTIDNLNPNSLVPDPTAILSVKYVPGQITFLAYLPPEIDVRRLPSYETITVHPIHVKDSSVFNNIEELGSKNNFVILTVNKWSSRIKLYAPHVSDQLYNGKIDVILKNTVVDDDKGEYRLTFPEKSEIQLLPFENNMNVFFALVMKDYIQLLKNVNNSKETHYRALKFKVSMPNLPEELVRVESVSKKVIGFRPEFINEDPLPVTTRTPAPGAKPAASRNVAPGAKPAASRLPPPGLKPPPAHTPPPGFKPAAAEAPKEQKGPEKKGFFSKLFS